MTLYKESFRTLSLFVLVFYIGSGLLGLWGTYQNIDTFGLDIVWDSISIILSLIYLGGGLYFVTHIKELLPRYRFRVIQVVTSLFLIEIAFTIISLVMVFIDTSSFDPSLVANPDPGAWTWILGVGLVSMLFSFAMYLVIVHAINTVSGIEHKQSTQLTIAYWIFLLLFLGALYALFWTNSFA